jgi:hypothetical protein
MLRQKNAKSALHLRNLQALRGNPGIEPALINESGEPRALRAIGCPCRAWQKVAALDKHLFQPVGKIAPAGVEHGNGGTLLADKVPDLDTAFRIVAETYVGKDKVKMTVLGTNERCCFAQ